MVHGKIIQFKQQQQISKETTKNIKTKQKNEKPSTTKIIYIRRKGM